MSIKLPSVARQVDKHGRRRSVRVPTSCQKGSTRLQFQAPCLLGSSRLLYLDWLDPIPGPPGPAGSQDWGGNYDRGTYDRSPA